MAYLHCHTKECGWGQDDFWKEDGYNPVSSLQKDSMLNEGLFKDKMYFDEWFFKENPSLAYKHDEGGWYCSGRDYVVWELRRTANNIERMFIPTWEEWEKVRDTTICPDCGQSNWDID